MVPPKHTVFAFLLGCIGLSSAAEPSRLAKAEAMFAERCKKAGVFIHRMAENVEGVFLMRLRPKEINFGDQYRLDDPYGDDIGGDGYFANFLYGRTAKGSLNY